jgi:hypothetical protein
MQYHVPERILSTIPRNPKRYSLAVLMDKERKEVHTVHSLVMEAFVGPRPDGYQVNHLNGNKHDNRVENLAWCTPVQNSRHAVTSGLNLNHGERHYKHRCTLEEVLAIRKLYASGMPIRTIAKQFSLPFATVQNITAYKTWKHVPED